VRCRFLWHIHILSQQHRCQKLPKSVDVRWSYSMQHQCHSVRNGVLRVSLEICQRKNFEIPYLFAKVVIKNRVCCFFETWYSWEKCSYFDHEIFCGCCYNNMNTCVLWSLNWNCSWQLVVFTMWCSASTVCHEPVFVSVCLSITS